MLILFPHDLLSPKVAGSHNYNAELGQGHNHSSTRLTLYNFFEQISMVLPALSFQEHLLCNLGFSLCLFQMSVLDYSTGSQNLALYQQQHYPRSC